MYVVKVFHEGEYSFIKDRKYAFDFQNEIKVFKSEDDFLAFRRYHYDESPKLSRRNKYWLIPQDGVDAIEVDLDKYDKLVVDKALELSVHELRTLLIRGVPSFTEILDEDGNEVNLKDSLSELKHFESGRIRTEILLQNMSLAYRKRKGNREGIYPENFPSWITKNSYCQKLYAANKIVGKNGSYCNFIDIVRKPNK